MAETGSLLTSNASFTSTTGVNLLFPIFYLTFFYGRLVKPDQPRAAPSLSRHSLSRCIGASGRSVACVSATSHRGSNVTRHVMWETMLPLLVNVALPLFLGCLSRKRNDVQVSSDNDQAVCKVVVKLCGIIAGVRFEAREEGNDSSRLKKRLGGENQMTGKQHGTIHLLSMSAELGRTRTLHRQKDRAGEEREGILSRRRRIKVRRRRKKRINKY